MIKNMKIKRVRAILNLTWNPIGLNLVDSDDEYDDYASYIVQRSDWREQELRDYLMYIEEEFIGLPVDAARKKVAEAVARTLMATDEA